MYHEALHQEVAPKAISTTSLDASLDRKIHISYASSSCLRFDANGPNVTVPSISPCRDVTSEL